MALQVGPDVERKAVVDLGRRLLGVAAQAQKRQVQVEGKLRRVRFKLKAPFVLFTIKLFTLNLARVELAPPRPTIDV